MSESSAADRVLAETPLEPTQFVCLGRRFMDNGKLYVRLAKVLPDGGISATMDFESNKNLARLNCGTVYSMPAIIVEHNWRIVPQSNHPVKLWDDQAKREEWRTQDWAAKLAYDVSRQADRETAIESLKLALRSQRKAYWRASSRSRAAIEVLVLMALRTPLTVEERTKKG